MVLAAPFVLSFLAGAALRELLHIKLARLAKRKQTHMLAAAFARGLKQRPLAERVAVWCAAWELGIQPDMEMRAEKVVPMVPLKTECLVIHDRAGHA